MAKAAEAVPQAFDRELDVRGLNCPLPALRARSALARMRSGQVLRVLASGREARDDFVRFARNTGNALVVRAGNREEFILYLRKG